MDATIKKSMWNQAGKAGLALAGISIAYMIFSQLISSGNMNEEPSTFISITSLIVWALKITGCILLMKFFMLKFYNSADVNKNEVFKMGMATALLSAFVYSAIYFINLRYISTDYCIELKNTLLIQAKQEITGEEFMRLSEMVQNYFLQFLFFSNLIYCFIYGTVISALISRSLPKKNPFSL